MSVITTSVPYQIIDEQVPAVANQKKLILIPNVNYCCYIFGYGLLGNIVASIIPIIVTSSNCSDNVFNITMAVSAIFGWCAGGILGYYVAKNRQQEIQSTIQEAVQ